MATSAERQRAYKAKLAASGFVQVNLWLPAGAVPEFQRAAEVCREFPHLTVARLVDRSSGRLVGLAAKSA